MEFQIFELSEKRIKDTTEAPPEFSLYMTHI